MLNWKDLYFPIGCGMARGGLLLNAPVIRAPDGYFKQVSLVILAKQILIFDVCVDVCGDLVEGRR